MLITTMNDVPGHKITDVYGEVFGLTVRSRNVGSQIGAAEVDSRRRIEGHDEGARRQPHGGDPAHDRRGGGEGRERDRRDALRHVGDGEQLDGDLRVRHGREDHAAVIRRSGADEAETHCEIQRERARGPRAHLPARAVPVPRRGVLRRWLSSTGSFSPPSVTGHRRDCRCRGVLAARLLRPSGVVGDRHRRRAARCSTRRDARLCGTATLDADREPSARRFYEKRGWRLNGETRVVPYPPNPVDVGYSYVREEP